MRSTSKVKTGAAAMATAMLAGGVMRARRRMHRNAESSRRSFAENVAPMASSDEGTSSEPLMDEAHAPGHRHLFRHDRDGEGMPPSRIMHRPFAKHQHGMRHPGRR